jgi:probable poly-beta-1,6-N-acetyl-D-glucosamine export protein
MFFHSINNLRAVSIILIVFAHTYWISGWQPQSSLSHLYSFIIFGGTFYFLFISGFLFNQLSVKHYYYHKFLMQKLRNVISPYVFLSILPIILAIKLKTVYPQYFFTVGDQGLWLEYIKPAILYLLTGRALTGYWYIPFIALVFIASPLFVQYSKLSCKNQLGILFVGIVISGFTYRSIDNMNPFQTFVYFSPMFLFGMICSIYNQKIKDTLSRYALWLVIISIVLAAYQTNVLGINTNLEKDMFTYAGFNFRLVGKSIQILGIYLIFENFMTKDYKILSLLASSSFAVFFLHPAVIFVIKRLVPTDWSGFIYWHLLTVFVIVVCVCGAWFAKKLLGNKSRYVIGW